MFLQKYGIKQRETKQRGSQTKPDIIVNIFSPHKSLYLPNPFFI